MTFNAQLDDLTTALRSTRARLLAPLDFSQHPLPRDPEIFGDDVVHDVEEPRGLLGLSLVLGGYQPLDELAVDHHVHVAVDLPPNRISNSGIAVTGSAGKTTVKEMIAAILARLGPVLATQGNFNNDIGVPLTLPASPSPVR